jgi:hypothetical protein
MRCGVYLTGGARSTSPTIQPSMHAASSGSHHVQGVSRVAVTFDTDYDAATGTTYTGTWHADPAYNQAQSIRSATETSIVAGATITGDTPWALP